MTTKIEAIHPHDAAMFIRPMLKDACDKHNIPEDSRKSLFENALDKFHLYSDGSVSQKTGGSIDTFVTSYVKNHSMKKAQAMPDEELRFNKLVELAGEGDMAAYRKCVKNIHSTKD